MTALSVHQALAELGFDSIELKWPNDLIVGDKKLSGILLESRVLSGRTFIVFGIGINFALSAKAKSAVDRPVIDLSGLSKSVPDRELVVATVCSTLLQNIHRFLNHGFERFQIYWNNHDHFLDETVVIDSGASQLTGKALGVNSAGELLLQVDEGIQKIAGGELLPSLRKVAEDS